MSNRPTVVMNASATNLMIVVMTWTEPMFLTPDRVDRRRDPQPGQQIDAASSST
jgi:hypothetical protein